MKKYGIIYEVKNKVNGKKYIGQTKNTLTNRKYSHLAIVRRGNYNYKSIFYDAIKKYGENNFVWKEIDNAYSKDELNKKEIYYIKEFDTVNNGYNIVKGGNGGDICSEFSEKRKKEIQEKRRKSFFDNPEKMKKFSKALSKSMKQNKKLIKSLTGRKLSEEHKLKISNGIQYALLDENKRNNISHKGIKKRPFSEEHKKHLSEALKIKKKSLEHRKNISLATKGKKRCKKCNKYFTIEEAKIHIKEGGQFANISTL